MEDQGREIQPSTTKVELSELWQAASRVVGLVDKDFAEACLYKALGWLKPEEWDNAKQLNIRTDLEYIQGERIKLIKAANLEPPAPSWNQWITDKEHRERLAFVAVGFAAVISFLAGTFKYFDGKEWVLDLFAKRETYSLCIGQLPEKCSKPWAPCGENPTGWAKTMHPDVCAYVESIKVREDSGNKCGYTSYRIACSTREKKTRDAKGTP